MDCGAATHDDDSGPVSETKVKSGELKQAMDDSKRTRSKRKSKRPPSRVSGKRKLPRSVGGRSCRPQAISTGSEAGGGGAGGGRSCWGRSARVADGPAEVRS